MFNIIICENFREKKIENGISEKMGKLTQKIFA